MKAQTRTQVLDILKGAASILVLLPDTPGVVDYVAVDVRVIIAAITRALESGK